MDHTVAEKQNPVVKKKTYDIFQDVITQFPSLNGYTHIVRAFETSHSISRDDYVAALQMAFNKLCSNISWLSHQVTVVDTGPGTSGFVKSVPRPDSTPPNTVVRVDKDEDFPSFATLVATEGFASTFDPANIFGLPARHGFSLGHVCAIRAVFIQGGVLVIMTTHNNMIDGIGMMQLWIHLSTLMNGGKLSAKAIQLGNADRSCVLPLLPPGAPIKNYNHLIRPNPWPLPPPPSAEWCVFHATRAGVADIKARATPIPTPAVPSISSSDALSAFCWQRVCTVRLRSGKCRADQISQFRRAASGRWAMGLTSDYMGPMMVHARTWLPMGEVVKSPLARIASLLRRDLEEWRDEWSVRSCATFMAGVPDKSQLLYGGMTNPETDLSGTSLLRFARSEPFRMGVLGESKMFREVDAPMLPGCLCFYPADNARDVQITMCLTSEDIDGLDEDTEWRRYVRHLGWGLDRFRL